MFAEEAQWIEKALEKLDLPDTTTVLDIGSSDTHYRTTVQPHIDRHIHQPLIKKGVNIHFLDMKEHEGVDIALDLADKSLPDTVFSDSYSLILCCNILEHVADRDIFIHNLLRFASDSTRLMLTVPRVFPKHNDPIDTMYRPSISELKKSIDRHAKCNVIEAQELVITEKEYYQYSAGRWLHRINLLPLRMILRWYLKPLRWKVTCMLLEIENSNIKGISAKTLDT